MSTLQPVLAFDVYGTLIDTHGVVDALTSYLGDKQSAQLFSQQWRDKQLEYSFRRAAMRCYVDFSECTTSALKYVNGAYDNALTEPNCEALLELYTRLPAFADARAGLERFAAAGIPCYAFSNGSQAAVQQLLTQAKLTELLQGIVSVENMRAFKPDPAVYAYFMRCAGVSAAQAWLISSNSFDVLGAKSAGMRSAWIKRSEAQQLDPWPDLEPDLQLTSLVSLAEHFGV